MRLVLTAALGAVIASGPAMAGQIGPVDRPVRPEIESRYTPALVKCPGLDRSTQEMIDCFTAEYARQDAALNRAYRDNQKGLTPPQKRKLQSAQRAWIAYRDAWCDAQRDEDWGTLSKVVAARCLVDETIRRTIELQSWPPAT